MKGFVYIFEWKLDIYWRYLKIRELEFEDVKYNLFLIIMYNGFDCICFVIIYVFVCSFSCSNVRCFYL